MKTKLPLLSLIAAVPALAFAQDLGNVDPGKFKMEKGKTTTETSVSSTKMNAKDEAQADLDANGNVVVYYKGEKKRELAITAEQKEEIFAELSKLMDKAEAQKRTVSKDIVLKHKGLFGNEVRAHLCATTAEIHKNYTHEVCAGALLQVSWSNAQTTKTTTDIPAEKPKPVPGHYSGDIFPPNKSDIPAGSAYAKELDKQIDEIVAEVKDGATLTGINIFSSASSLRNTGDAEKDTHLQLSRDRSEQAFRYVAKRLNDAGIKVDTKLSPNRDGAQADSESNDKVSLDFGGGESCNGVTGENPPANYKWTNDLDKKVAGTPAVALDDQSKAAVREEYNKYQYVDVSFETMPKSDPKQIVEESRSEQDYYASVAVYAKEREKGPPGPPLLGFLRRIHGPRPHKKWGSTDCPTW